MPGTKTISLALDEALVDALDEEIAPHDISRSEYVRYIIKVRHDRTELRGDLDRATERNEELEAELGDVRTTVDELREENDDLRHERNELRRALERTESRLEDLQRRLRESSEPTVAERAENTASRTDGEGNGNDERDGQREKERNEGEEQGSDGLAACADRLKTYLG